jgi:hypothetical protein
MEKDGCKSFQSDTQLATGQSLPLHASKLLQDWDSEECKKAVVKV